MESSCVGGVVTKLRNGLFEIDDRGDSVADQLAIEVERLGRNCYGDQRALPRRFDFLLKESDS